MGVCSSCGQEVSGEKKLCTPCREQLISKTWKRQMLTYSVIVALGLAMVVYSYFQFTDHHYLISEAPPRLLITTILGGLGLMGGLFGLALALFFSIWHRKSGR
jgi:H+/Cl- antiporter ClcA